MKKQSNLPIEELAVTALNEQGYAFRHRCLTEIKERAEKDGWYLEEEEYPVSTGEKEAVIDFVLGCHHARNYYFVFECKRAHPDYVAWVFADTLVYRADRRLRATAASCNPSPGELKNKTACQETWDVVIEGCWEDLPFVDTGLEVLLNRKKDRISQSTKITEACTQALTGVAGLSGERVEQLRKSPEAGHWIYIPVVVTTAKLYHTKFRGSKISLENGTIKTDQAITEKILWVYYDFPIRSSLPLTPAPDNYHGTNLRDLKRRFKVKTVIIVTSSALVDLLTSMKLELSRQ